MAIFMFIIFLVTNLFCISSMYYSIQSDFEYNNGMYLGVHIPPEHSKDIYITGLISKSRQLLNKYQLINAIISVAICFINFYSLITFMLIFIIWIIQYCIIPGTIINSAHKKLYNYKLENNWLIETQKRKIYIDTQLYSDDTTFIQGNKLHFIMIAIQLLLFIPVILKRNETYFTSMLILFNSSLLVSLCALFINTLLNRHCKKVYSTSSNINKKIYSMSKKYNTTATYLLSAINTFAWTFIVFLYFINRHIGNMEFYVYISLQIISTICFIIPLFMLQHKKNNIINSNEDIIYVDDDEYWKTGYYCNPSDSRILVPNRINTANYAFNYGRPAARLLSGAILALTAGCFLWAFVTLIPFVNLTINTKLTEDSVIITAASYKSDILFDEITELKLINELPDDDFFKSNGGATDEYLVGNFRGTLYKKAKLYIWCDKGPVLMICTNDATIFVNSDKDGEIEQLYRIIKDNTTNV